MRKAIAIVVGMAGMATTVVGVACVLMSNIIAGDRTKARVPGRPS